MRISDRYPNDLVILLLMGCLSLTGCVSVEPPFPKVTDSNKRYEFTDFAVRPPPGVDWLVRQTASRAEESEIIFFKDLHYTRYPATHSFYVSARSGTVTNTFHEPEAFLAFAQQWCITANPARFKLLESHCEPDPRFGDYCVKFRIKSQDYGAHEGGSVLTLDMGGYLFRHPQATNHVVTVFWSERGRSDELDPSLKDAGERFIDNLQLLP